MLNRSIAPKLFFNSTINELRYDTLILKNDIPLYSIFNSSLDVCEIEIVFGGGKIDEHKKGVAFFATNLLTSGIKGYNSNEINNFFEKRGAFIQFRSGFDYNILSLYCLTSKLNEVFPFFLRLFTEPLFTKNDLEKLKSKKKQELSINEQKTNFLASKLFQKTLFEGHPYANVLSLNNIELITSDNLKTHWKLCSLNNIKFISISGNFNIDKIGLEIEKKIVAKKGKKIVYLNRFRPKNKSVFIQKKLDNSTQSSLKIGLCTISLKDEKYPALALGNSLFGGHFGSRLMQNIREKKGLTYSISSSIQHLQQSSYLQISADIKMGTGHQVINLIKTEFNKLVLKKIALDELNKTKSYLIGKYKANTETIFDKMNKVKFLKINNLEDSFFINQFNSIQLLTPEDIQATLAKNVNFNALNTILIE